MDLDSFEILKFMIEGFIPLIKTFISSSLLHWVILPGIIISLIFKSGEARNLVTILGVVFMVVLGVNYFLNLNIF